MLVLSGLRWVDQNLKQERHGTLRLTTEGASPTQDAIRATVERAGYRISLHSVAFVNQSKQRQVEFRLKWRERPDAAEAPPFLNEIAADPGILAAAWEAT